MGRSLTHSTLTRSQNKKRKDLQRFHTVKKYRRTVLGQEKNKENSLQQQVHTHHDKSILKAKVMELRARRAAERAAEAEAEAAVAGDEEEEEEEEEEAEEDEEDDDAAGLSDLETASGGDSDCSGEAPSAKKKKTTDAAAAAKKKTPEKKAVAAAAAAAAAAAPEAKKEFPPLRVTGERYRVVSNSLTGIVVRATAELTSAVVGRVEADRAIDVVEEQGRRGRIAAPLQGWVSLRAGDGALICRRDFDDGTEVEGAEEGAFEVAGSEEGGGSDDEDEDEDGSEAESEAAEEEEAKAAAPAMKKRDLKRQQRTRDRGADRKRKKQEKVAGGKRQRFG